MCIICNVTCGSISEMHEKLDVAERFLSEFRNAQEHMKAAAEHMLAVSKIACQPEDRKRYDAVHKDMVRKIREWNKLEEKREHEPPGDIKKEG